MENVKELNLMELVMAVVRKIWLVILLAVLAAAAMYIYTQNFITPLYRSSVTIYVNNKSATISNSNVSATDLATSQRLVATYIEILSSDSVLAKVAEKVQSDPQNGFAISAGAIRGMMTASARGETEVFDVRISHADPKKAAIIANAIADVAPDEIAYFIEGSSTKIVDYAKMSAAPYNMGTTRNVAIGLMGGAVVAVALIVLQALLDVRIKGEEDLAVISNAPVLGMIPDLMTEGEASYGYRGYKTSYKAQPYKAKSGEGEA